MTCPLCNSSHLIGFLNRRQVPVYQNAIFRDQRAAIDCMRGDLEQRLCQDCGFIFNAAFQATKLSYDAGYENDQSSSPYFNTYVDDLIRFLVEEEEIKDKFVVEVGCGKGHFIKKLIEEGHKNRGWGIDPTYTGPEEVMQGRLRFCRQSLDRASWQEPAEVVICRHVIEHVPDPIQFLKTLRSLGGEGSPIRLYLETPCVEWIVSHFVLWDFFYEHCSYFSAGSLSALLHRAGFDVKGIRRVFGDQYLWVNAVGAGEPPRSASNRTALPRLQELCERFGNLERKTVEEWRMRLGELSRLGAVALWGAGAKGATFANLVDPDRTLLACVVDLNPQKQGGFLPGTGHPIVNYLDLPSWNVSTAIQMNPNYGLENVVLLNEAQLKVQLIDPTSWRTIQ